MNKWPETYRNQYEMFVPGFDCPHCTAIAVGHSDEDIHTSALRKGICMPFKGFDPTRQAAFALLTIIILS